MPCASLATPPNEIFASSKATRRRLVLSAAQIESFQQDGVILLRGAFADWIEILRAGVDYNMANPGPWGREYLDDNQSGRFFGDYCNWNQSTSTAAYSNRRRPNCRRPDALRQRADHHEHVLVKGPA